MPTLTIPTAEPRCRPFFETDSAETMLAAVLHDYDDLRVEEVPRPAANEPGTEMVKIDS